MERNNSSKPLEVRHVIVPLDGSSFAAAAIPTARALATRFGADLSTISVALDDREAEHLRAHAEDVVGGDASDGVRVVLGDDPASAITSVASRDGSVIVMSTRGRGRVSGALLGSVARSVLSSSSAPFIAVGPRGDRPSHFVGRPRRRPDSWPGPLSEGGIVALVDGTAASEAVLAPAAQWARGLDTELVVLSVAEDAPSGLDGVRSNRFGPEDAKAYVGGLAERWHTASPNVRGEVVFDPVSVASGVARYLASHPTALVALTASGHSGFARLRLGATAADIVRASTVPALVVPNEVRPARAG